jgi:hypothetical protein
VVVGILIAAGGLTIYVVDRSSDRQQALKLTPQRESQSTSTT